MAKAKKQKTPQQIIQNVCSLLSALGVTQIKATYDGSGDSGDLDDITFYFGGGTATEQPDYGFHAGHTNGMSLYSFKQQYVAAVEEKRQIVKNEQLDAFTEAIFYFLPGGWEIDAGSFGELVIDVKKGTIAHEHNERVTETHTTHNTYELAPQNQTGDKTA